MLFVYWSTWSGLWNWSHSLIINFHFSDTSLIFHLLQHWTSYTIYITIYFLSLHMTCSIILLSWESLIFNYHIMHLRIISKTIFVILSYFHTHSHEKEGITLLDIFIHPLDHWVYELIRWKGYALFSIYNILSHLCFQ